MLKRYASEIFPDLLAQCGALTLPRLLWDEYDKGERRHHLAPWCSGFDSKLTNRSSPHWMDTLLSSKELVVAQSFVHDARTRQNSISSLQGLMNHMECRGHEQAPYVEGLTVDLLPFQLQSLQWAVERETVAGGVQSFFWSKLPSLDTSLYYSPIIGRFSRSKGGIIAEQMGL